MKPIPLPSHVHYELLLQLLERKTIIAVEKNPALREQVQQLIISLRKALAQQKQLEATCNQTYTPIEYRWSLNSVNGQPETASEVITPRPLSSEQES
ncbi:conserved hypothetical protein [Gloeothece citriformis PCC 7424]|uniref:DUF5340 domain-containing protein n=1 Tax=Gloeothece citriformis (strain PCC 7424) TaxID=65393 RepID=B7KJ99_GLOC7|nr:DUF5340 domain-containing protein [Gloeothece citriformis]ACK72183.1 conserved hypothetical protein [Gloeothece citriformis PCC 7424]